MTEKEHLLICLAEECAEVIYEVTKSLRFGLDDYQPDYAPNEERLSDEMNDLMGVVNLLQERGVKIKLDAGKMVKKREKVLKYINYAHEKGILTKN